MKKVDKMKPNTILVIKETDIEKIGIGTKRNIIQIQKTIKFEISRNINKFVTMLIVSSAIFLLSMVLTLIQENQNIPSPQDPVDYILGFLGFISILCLIVATSFGGSIIVEDFEKMTGNTLFPKISRGRLLAGRLVARTIYASLTIAFYYVLIAISTLIKYEILPFGIWESMLWAIYYTFALLCFTTFFSSIMNRSSTAMVMTFMFIMMVFGILTSIMMFSGVTIEPLFMLDYYANIITNCFDMPLERFKNRSYGMGPGGISDISFKAWSTPSAFGALVGMAIYSTILLATATYVYKYKQSKH